MKTIKLMLCVLISCGTFSTLIAGNPFIASASQAIEDASGRFVKNEVLFTSGTTINVLEVHDETETFKIKFVADNWLDITSTVTVVGGPGVTFSKILNKGKASKMVLSNGSTLAGNFTYCEVEFKIASNASIGERTVALKRPNLTFGMDETVFKLKVRKSARIYNIGLASGSAQATTSGTRSNLQATVQGFDENIQFKSSNLTWLTSPTISMKGKFAFNFSTAFKRSGSYGPSSLEADLLVPNDVVLVSGRNEINGVLTTINITNSNPAPPRPGGGGIVVSPPKGGGINVGGGGGGALTVDLSVTFLSTFTSSGTNFIASEMGTYNLCSSTKNPNVTTIPTLKIRVVNLGTANSTPCTLTFNRGSNANFANNLTLTVPALSPGQQMDFDIPRIESRVCATKNSTGACIRCGSGIQGINHWNDKGVSATLSGVTGDTNTSNNSQTIF